VADKITEGRESFVPPKPAINFTREIIQNDGFSAPKPPVPMAMKKSFPPPTPPVPHQPPPSPPPPKK
jgi:hypothetical protein